MNGTLLKCSFMPDTIYSVRIKFICFLKSEATRLSLKPDDSQSEPHCQNGDKASN